MQGNRSIPLPLGKDSSALLNFGQRKSQGELFSSSSKSFHNLRKVVMPRLQLVVYSLCSASGVNFCGDTLLISRVF